VLNIFFRADGNSSIGLGHLYRCCALSEIVGKQFHRTLFTRSPFFEGFEAIASYFDKVIDLSESMSVNDELDTIASNQHVQIIVLDGYSFDANYQQGIKDRSNAKLVCVDDIYAYHFLADVIINHAGGIERHNYSCDASTQLFLGVKYAIIRPLFGKASWVGNDRPMAREKSILITYGAADPHNRTQTTLQRLVTSGYDNYELNVVVGGANKYRDNLMQEFITCINVKFHLSVNAAEMVGLMQRCGICIASPSTVSLEYLNSSSGILVSDVIADNQNDFYRYLVDNEYSLPLESYLNTPENCSGIDFRKVQETFDGLSSFRLNDIFKALA
jgi:UDP-2,4-diacetamido-2,4,6-trideoxy-beta-L-altropyranose hydrolase